MKNSFVLYNSYMEQIELLSREQRGDLFTAIMCYARKEALPDMDGITQMAFAFIKAQMDVDTEKYKEICEKRRESGRQGGRPPKANGSSEKAKKANGFLEKQTKAKKADNEYDNDNDNEIIIYIVEFLNEKCNTNYRSTTAKTRQLIRARLRDGYTKEDFEAVIQKKAGEWMGTEQEKYLRPETLFGTKFESYLNQHNTQKSKNGFQNFSQRENVDYESLQSRLLMKGMEG